MHRGRRLLLALRVRRPGPGDLGQALLEPTRPRWPGSSSTTALTTSATAPGPRREATQDGAKSAPGQLRARQPQPVQQPRRAGRGGCDGRGPCHQRRDGQRRHRLPQGGVFPAGALSLNNTSAPVWQLGAVTENGQTTVTGNVFVPKTHEHFGYDLDGNLTQRRAVELHLGRREPPGQPWPPTRRWGRKSRSTSSMTARGRRIRKQVWSNKTWSGDRDQRRPVRL